MSEDDIIDNAYQLSNGYHARKSFFCFCISLSCYILINLMEYFGFPVDSVLVFVLVLVLTISGILFPFIGLYYAVKSIRNKEANSFYKIIGIGANLVLSVVVICGLTYFAYHIFITESLSFHKRW